jgi:hypothetical protein
VPFSGNTIIYENKVSEQNVIPWFKDNVISRSNQGQIKAKSRPPATFASEVHGQHYKGCTGMPDEI